MPIATSRLAHGRSADGHPEGSPGHPTPPQGSTPRELTTTFLTAGQPVDGQGPVPPSPAPHVRPQEGTRP